MLGNSPTKACEIAVACNVLPQSACGIKLKIKLSRQVPLKTQHTRKTTPQQDRMPEACLEESH
jgi:hypothetical protein